MNEIKPIETFYKGYRFRSRAEARWAVFFDACNVKWDYEPEGYDLEDGLGYLPDFLLHNIGIRGSEDDGQTFDLYIEVKGSNKITPEEYEKIRKFSPFLPEEHEKYKDDYYSRLKNKKKILVVGSVPQNIREMEDLWNEDSCFYNFDYIDDDFFTALLCVKNGQLLVRGGDSNYLFDIDYKATERALKLARSVRFEHGMKPTVVPLPIKQEYSYNGTCFDNEIEARWAVFFDACGVNFDYKPEITLNKEKYTLSFLLYNVQSRPNSKKLKDIYIDVNNQSNIKYAIDTLLFNDKVVSQDGEEGLPFSIVFVSSFPKKANKLKNIFDIADCFYEEYNHFGSDDYYSYSYVDLDNYPLAFLINNHGNLALRGGDYLFDDIDFYSSKEAFEKAETEKFNNNRPYIFYDTEGV